MFASAVGTGTGSESIDGGGDVGVDAGCECIRFLKRERVDVEVEAGGFFSLGVSGNLFPPLLPMAAVLLPWFTYSSRGG